MTVERTVLLSLNARAADAAREVEKFKVELTRAKLAEAEARAVTDQHKLELVKIRRALLDAKVATRDAKEEARKYAAATKTAADAQGKASRSGFKLFKSLVDVKSGLDIAIGMTRRFVSAVDDLLVAGTRYNNLLKANRLGIDDAREATRGSISDVELLGAANKAQQFGPDLTSKQFGEMAKGAAIAAQAMGTDVVKSIDRLILGIGRKSKPILDDLGLIVSVKEANEDWAESNGTVVASMTEAQKQQAFMNKVLAELNRVSAAGKVSTADLGGSYQALKNDIDNLYHATVGAIASSEGFARALAEDRKQLERVAAGAEHVIAMFGALTRAQRAVVAEIEKGNKRVTNSFAETERKLLEEEPAWLRATKSQTDALKKAWTERQSLYRRHIRKQQQASRTNDGWKAEAMAKGQREDARVIKEQEDRHTALVKRGAAERRKAKQRRAEQEWHDAELRHKRFQKAEGRRQKEEAEREKQWAKHLGHYQTFVGSMIEAISAGASAGDAVKILKAAAEVAAVEAALEFGRAAAAAARYDFASAGLHVIAGTALAAVSGGLSYGAAQVGGGGGGGVARGGGAITGGSGPGSRGGGFGREFGGGGGDGPAPGGGGDRYVFIGFTRRLVTRKELKKEARRMQQGRL